jgi:hypothetical protein
MFNAAKDALAGKSAQIFLNERIARYGRIERFRLDSQEKKIEVICQLDGEPAPIAVNVEKYVVTTDGSKRYIELSRCTCSRPWLQNLLNDFAEGRRFELPGWAAAAL